MGTVSEFLNLSREEEYQIELKLSKSKNHQLSFLDNRTTEVLSPFRIDSRMLGMETR